MTSDIRISAAGAVFRGSLAQQKARTTLAVVAIALGVALGYAVQLINAAAINELAQGVQTLSGDADLEVRGPRGGFDEALYPVLARMADVAVASPVVEVDARLAGRAETLRIVGLDVFQAAAIQPGLVPATDDALAVLRPDALFLTPAAARALDARAGDTVDVQVGLAAVSLSVAGLLAATGQQRFAVMDIAGAQQAFERIGRVSRLDLRLAPGADVDAFRARLAPLLPAGVAVARPEATLAAGTSLSRSYRVNLNVLALVALFTGGLLVFSTQALAVVRRRAQFALLRVLGLTRRHLTALIVAEGAVVGVAGSALGIGAGYALAQAAIRWVGADLGSGYFRGVVPALAVELPSLALFFALGVAAAVFGSLVPALEAVRAAPALALKAGDEARAFAKLRPVWPGALLIAAGALATVLPPVADLPVFGYVAIALLLVGTLTLMPWLALFVLRVLPSPRGAAPRLALAQLAGAPGQVTVSLAAIVASVGLMVSMAIMVGSFRHSVDAWLDRILPADLYFRAAPGGDTAYLGPEFQHAVARLPGVRRAEFLRETQLLLDPGRPRVVLLARTVDLADPARTLPLIGAAHPIADGDAPPVWVSEAAADLYGFVPGQTIALPIAEQAVRSTVAGVWRDYARQGGAIVIERERYVALTGDRTATNAALWLAPGATADTVRAAIVRDVPGGDRLEIAAPGEIRAASLSIFDRTFAVTYALELAAVGIGLVALSSSFGALVLARRREFGMLRHLGMTRRQIGAMLATEGATVTGIGLVAGLSLGWLISLILIHVVNRQSFHWGMELAVPWAALAGLAAIVLALATGTAVASGRQAMDEDAVRAVKEDW
ncbi:MAG: ABC transporter permease [Betaproteobacteria bacterium]